MIQKILIANRGEIAVRIAKTCRQMGIQSVAVYSDIDAESLHVKSCDEGICLGGETSAESYLSIPAILHAARRVGADAIHPGYGFLSENAAFATACQEAGISFIGPSSEAIRVMGSKSESKARMREVGVPTIPGTTGIGKDLDALVEEAKTLRFPVLVKASAGGGGKGMRKVDAPERLKVEMEIAAREAEKAFGDPTLLVEEYVESPRHVEIQVFGDHHGHIVHLFERECSIQRRHQKIVEESPSPALTPELRKAMGEAAVRAAKSVDYVGAGTVEFVLAPDGAFYFLEMNTRLQVEHPVTEAVTGLDLVREQIRVAEGLPLSFDQESLRQVGAALECRIYAEDPSNQFLPATGNVLVWDCLEGDGLRVDTGVESGSSVSIHYDPMLAKLITLGTDRNEAIRRMQRALRDMSILGVVTNRTFLQGVLAHPEFLAGKTDTHFIDRNLSALEERNDAAVETHAAIASVLLSAVEARKRTLLPGMLTGYRNNRFRDPIMEFQHGDRPLTVTYRHTGPSSYRVWVEETSATVSLEDLNGGHSGHLTLDGHRIPWRMAEGGDEIWIQTPAGCTALQRLPRFPVRNQTALEGGCLSPMPGKVVSIFVKEGQAVSKGQVIASVEAMKMEHQVLTGTEGIVEEILVTEGEQVDARAPLAVIRSSAEG